MSFIKQLIQNFNSWLFAEVDLRRLAFFRIIVSLSLLTMYIPRHLNFFDDFFGPKGLAPRAYALKLYETFYRPPFEWFFWPDQMNSLMHLALIFSLILVLLGVGGRAILWIAWILDIAFIHRNYSIIFGADLIGAIWMFYLAGTQCSSAFSLSAWLKKKKQELTSDMSTQVFFRLMQIQICAIYMFTGFEKLKGQSWWDGSALWTVLGNTQMVAMDLSWVRHFPLVVGVMSFLTILFEIYFPILVWIKKYRNAAIIFGLAFHAGIAVSMNLYQFSALMVGTYLFFIDKNIIDKISLGADRLLGRGKS